MIRLPLLTLPLAALTAAALALALAGRPGPATAEPEPAAATAPKVPESAAEIGLSFAPVVRRAAPAVANVYASRVIESRRPRFASDPFFDDFFRSFGDPRPRVQNSLGSGVILSADGILVTNFHVVGEATEIRAVLNDRREFDATVLLSDAEADLAILKLEGAEDLPHLGLRDSDGVEVGELVLAIGNPFGVGQTVSSGIVSGLARSGTATGNARGYFIQTDAPINPGNSGGALIDLAGRLIGVNTSILSRSGGSNGIGFAIPAALVRQFVAQARAGNTAFERPWAGLNGQPVDASMAEGLGQDLPGGLVISDLHETSPFRAAGFERGDVILAVDGAPVNTPAEMIFRMSVAGLGAEARVTRVAAGQAEDVTVTMAAAPDTPPRAELVTGDRAAIPGLRLATINPSVLAEMDLPLSSTGVAVLDPGSVGLRAGLRRGDVIEAVDGRAVATSAEAEAALAAATRRLALDIRRGTERVTMRFRL